MGTYSLQDAEGGVGDVHALMRTGPSHRVGLGFKPRKAGSNLSKMVVYTEHGPNVLISSRGTTNLPSVNMEALTL